MQERTKPADASEPVTGEPEAGEAARPRPAEVPEPADLQPEPSEPLTLEPEAAYEPVAEPVEPDPSDDPIPATAEAREAAPYPPEPEPHETTVVHIEPEALVAAAEAAEDQAAVELPEAEPAHEPIIEAHFEQVLDREPAEVQLTPSAEEETSAQLREAEPLPEPIIEAQLEPVSEPEPAIVDAAEPDEDRAAAELPEAEPQPEPILEAQFEPVYESEQAVADSVQPAAETFAELRGSEPEPDVHPVEAKPEPAHDEAKPAEPTEPSEPPLHERIPAVLPSVDLLHIRPASVVPVFEPIRRAPEIPQPLPKNSARDSEPIALAPISGAIAIPQRADSVAASRSPVLAPSRPVGHTFGSTLRRAVRFAATVAVALVCLILALIVMYRWVNPPASTLMLGQWLTGTRISQRWVPIDSISPYLHRAVIASEDGHFCRHHGVDWGELEEAIERARDGIPRGGSTISMQVVKNLFLWPSKSYVRKALEIPFTYAIELAWSKRRILEIYLNIAEWGPGIFGAEAAAQYHFGKSAAALTPSQSALLAVSLPNPLERRAGAPGPGTLRLAASLHGRMQASPGNAACIRPRS